MMDQYSNVNLTSYTSASEHNYYFYNTKSTPMSTGISDPTMGLMMLLSTLQYQPSYVAPMYSNAVEQASKAAYVQAGGKKMEDTFKEKGIILTHDAGITNTEGAIVLGVAKTIQSKQLNWDNLKIDMVKIHVGLSSGNGSVGIKYEW